MNKQRLAAAAAAIIVWGCLTGLALIRLWAVLYGTLSGPALMALAALLEHNGLITPLISGMVSIFGQVLMVIALWVQFGKKNGGGGGVGGPRF